MRRLGSPWFVALVAVLLATFAGVAGFCYLVDDDRRLPRAATRLVIPNGTDTAGVARLLRSAGVISNPLVFRAYVRLEGTGRNLRAGEFAFPAHESVADVLRRVTTGGSQLATWITIPEGFTAREIAQTYAQNGFGDEPELERALASDEGYLFPDTYLMPVAASPGTIARTMTDEFRTKLPPGPGQRARRLGYTLPQVVTIASMIEREGKADDERPLIASVIYNRLRLGMKLQIDATLEYTFAHHKDVITNQDLAIDTPYNTYLHAGLPPTPIANPGEPSLRAAFDPVASPFLYYVYMGNGHHAFARTLAEHNANVARYLP